MAKNKRPPKRGAKLTGRAIDRLTPEDREKVRRQVADFYRYLQWMRKE